MKSLRFPAAFLALIAANGALAADPPKQASADAPTTLPKHLFADGSSALKLPPSPFVSGGWGLKLPRAILIASPAPDFLPKNLLAFDPDDEIQDIVFLGEDRPVVVRARVLVGGRGFRVAWGDFAHRLYRYLDRNDDRVVTLKEANLGNAVQGILSGGPFQNNPQNNNPAGPKLDEDKDDRVSFSELMAYLAPRSTPFSVQPGQGADARSESVFSHIDRDRDRKLSKQEVDEAAQVLRRFDLNEDEALTVAEIGPFQGRFANQRRFNAMGNAQGLSALALRGGQPIAPVVAAVVARYDRPKDPENLATKDGKLGPDELKVDRGAFDRADKNRDALLDTAELTAFLQGAKPDLAISMQVDLKTGRGTMEVGGTPGGSPPLAEKARKAGNDVVDLDLGAVQASWKVQPTRKNPNGFDIRGFFLSTFHGADADGNNALDKKELEQAQFLNQILGAADRDGDAILKEAELIGYLDLTDLAGWSRTTLTVSDLGRALFNHLDRDHDQRLGSREVRQAWRVLQGDDRDRDGRVSAREIPRHFLLAFGRAQANNQFLGFVEGGDEEEIPIPSADPASVAPKWFLRMDRNRDGDVTRREFLGNSADFSKIDADRDGLISPREAAAAG